MISTTWNCPQTLNRTACAKRVFTTHMAVFKPKNSEHELKKEIITFLDGHSPIFCNAKCGFVCKCVRVNESERYGLIKYFSLKHI